MLKKSIAMLLTLSLCFSLASVAFAAETTKISAEAQTLVSRFDGDVKKDRVLLNQGAYDLDLFSVIALDDTVKIHSVDVTGQVTYKVDHEDIGVTDFITVEKDAAGNTIMSFTEDDKHNELMITTDGRMVLDGHVVTVDGEPAIVSSPQSSGMIQPIGIYHRIFGVTPVLDGRGKPKTPQNFYATGLSYYGPNISLGSDIAAMVVTVLISVVSSAAGPLLGTTISRLLIASDGISLLQSALTVRKDSLKTIADQCNGATAVSVGVTEFAKNGNDSLYSEWYYSVTLGMMTYAHYSAAKRTAEAT